jgi:hypothetical protein
MFDQDFEDSGIERTDPFRRGTTAKQVQASWTTAAPTEGGCRTV